MGEKRKKNNALKECTRECTKKMDNEGKMRKIISSPRRSSHVSYLGVHNSCIVFLFIARYNYMLELSETFSVRDVTSMRTRKGLGLGNY